MARKKVWNVFAKLRTAARQIWMWSPNRREILEAAKTGKGKKLFINALSVTRTFQNTAWMWTTLNRAVNFPTMKCMPTGVISYLRGSSESYANLVIWKENKVSFALEEKCSE